MRCGFPGMRRGFPGVRCVFPVVHQAADAVPLDLEDKSRVREGPCLLGEHWPHWECEHVFMMPTAAKYAFQGGASLGMRWHSSHLIQRLRCQKEQTMKEVVHAARGEVA